MQRIFALFLMLALLISVGRAWGVELVQQGRPLAEIVIGNEPLPQVRFAAQELQDHVQKMSGVRLPIVVTPTKSVVPIYVGESEHTRSQGLHVDDLEMEGFKIVVTDRYLALIGRDATFPRYPRGHESAADRPRLLHKWQEQTGESWDFPWRNFYDPRNYNAELGFSLYDPTGTLFAVYEFLEQLGVRWYLPYHDFGTVIPERGDIAVAPGTTVRNPLLSSRQIWFSFPASDRDGFIWFKRQKLGTSQMQWIGHGTSEVTRHSGKDHPEYFSVIDGRPQLPSGDGRNPGHPRLAPSLRDAMIRFGDAFFTQYPELKYVSAGPSDGYLGIDERDRTDGWLHEERGYRGELSNYVWTFINEVAEGLARKHPDKIVMGLAYSRYRMPPTNIERFHPNVGVTYCQTRCELVTPEQRRAAAEERRQWFSMLPSGEFQVWDYFLYYRPRSRLAGVPVLFTRAMQEDMQALRGISRGEYIEAWGGGGKLANPGLNHLNIYLQARLYWEPDLNLSQFIDEYTSVFYGPAAAEMKEFLTYAEQVWMRPGSRDVYAADAFLGPDDIERYFEILSRAKAQAGETLFGRRIDLLIAECLPSRDLFAFPAYYEQGLAAAKQGDGKTAEAKLTRAVALAQDPRSKANALYELGQVHQKLLNQSEQALDAYRRCMQVQVRGAGSAVRYHARMRSVDVLHGLERYDEAIALLDEVHVASEGYRRIEQLISYGQIMQARGLRDEAIARYQQALAVEGISDGQRRNLQRLLRDAAETRPHDASQQN